MKKHALSFMFAVLLISNVLTPTAFIIQEAVVVEQSGDVPVAPEQNLPPRYRDKL